MIRAQISGEKKDDWGMVKSLTSRGARHCKWWAFLWRTKILPVDSGINQVFSDLRHD